MTSELLVLAIILGPVIVLTLFRASGSTAFLSLCLGSLLVHFVGGSASDFGNLLSANTAISQSMMPIILLVLPVVFATIFMIRTVRGKMRLLLNIIPAVATGVVGLLLVVPLLPKNLHETVVQTQLWLSINPLTQLIVVVSTIISIFFLWLQRPKTVKKDKSAKA